MCYVCVYVHVLHLMAQELLLAGCPTGFVSAVAKINSLSGASDVVQRMVCGGLVGTSIVVHNTSSVISCHQFVHIMLLLWLPAVLRPRVFWSCLTQTAALLWRQIFSG